MKLTLKERIFQVMEWDIPFHLTELMERTGAEYGTVSKTMDDFMKAALVERVGDKTGVYIRHSEKGRIKFQIKELQCQLKIKEESILKLKGEYLQLAEEYKEKINELNLLNQDTYIES